MDVFSLRDNVVDQFARYVRGFHRIADPDTRAFVDGFLGSGSLWPEPLIQLNPSFELGPTVDELAANGTLHPECANIFRLGKQPGIPTEHGDPLRLYRHQAEAIDVARTGASYVLTTGTGSGKSLAYILPIVDHCRVL